ncbi:MAG: hypothetical protein KFF49_07860 [Bacteroidales bacterium]|nr:hypothetical protein [Bacteroidales bacterium]
MNWEINLDLWDSESYNNNIAPVINELSAEFDRLVDAPPPLAYKPIRVVNDLYYGMRVYKPLADDHYKVGLTVGHLTYGKVAYQYAHVLSNIYTDPRQITWLANAMAHMASFRFLDYFSEKWIDDYPGPAYVGEYEAFSSLKSEKIKTAFENVDIMLNLASNEWIKEEVSKLDQSMDHAPAVLFDLIGLELQPLFREDYTWKLFSYLGKGTKTPLDDPRDLRCRPRAKPDFDNLRAAVPSDLKDLVDKIYHRLH